ncbi:T9SS type A sorting domain-containing protein [Bernardetia sp. ABR2-2B]|uniref:T9SS type A sorting domain-containing protein n=1 Tax=Bernardetia sp. ABR2-2B TaxID=3127472 RepID=UPI0030CFF093
MNQKRIYLSILFFLFFSYSQAAIIYVDNDSQGSNDGQTWKNAYHNLGTALRNARYGDIIRVDQGNYIAPTGGFTLINGVKIYGGYNVRYIPNTNILVAEWLINATRFFGNLDTVIEGNPAFSSNQNLDKQTLLDGLKVINISNVAIGLGSNVSIFEMKINNCSFFKDNGFTSHFMRLSNYQGSFSPEITNSYFATSFGIYVRFTGNSTVLTQISNSEFEGFTAIKMENTFAVTSSSINIKVQNSRFLNSVGLDLNFLLVNNNVRLNIENSIFDGSSDPAFSSGIINRSVVDVNVYNSTFYNTKSYVNNQMNMSSSYFYNCIFWGGGQVFSINVGSTSLDNCLIDKNDCNFLLTHTSSIANCSNNIYNQNPQFISTNPTSPDYLKLSATSPARNAGNNAYATGKGYGGNDRVLEGTVDIGAYEFCPSGTSCINNSPTGGGYTSRKITTNNMKDITNDLLVYPNPVKDVVKIKSSDKILSIEVLNVQGQTISSTKNSNSIQLKNVAKGMYLLKITTDKGIQTKRIIKE